MVRVQPIRVLVVDDEEALAESFAEALMGRGHVAETAFSGRLALSCLKERSYDVILADVRMAEMDGIQLFKQVISDIPELVNRFVFITGEPLPEQLVEFLEAHETPCLSKPVGISLLAEVVERRAGEGGQAS